MEERENALRELFFQTGLPEAYCLARRMGRREERERKREVHHPGNRPAGDQL